VKEGLRKRRKIFKTQRTSSENSKGKEDFKGGEDKAQKTAAQRLFHEDVAEMFYKRTEGSKNFCRTERQGD